MSPGSNRLLAWLVVLLLSTTSDYNLQLIIAR
jgi:hypothetical protein